MDPKEYTGKEWTDLLREMSPREVRKVLKKAYRRTAKKAIGIAQDSLRTSGLGGDMKSLGRCIRPYIYSKGGGFLVTVNARRGKANGSGEKGMYKTARGAKKPILMWAEGGTDQRRTKSNSGKHRRTWTWRLRRGHNTGRMQAYRFMSITRDREKDNVSASLQDEFRKYVTTTAKRYGCTV